MSFVSNYMHILYVAIRIKELLKSKLLFIISQDVPVMVLCHMYAWLVLKVSVVLCYT